MAQSVERPTSAHVMISRSVSSSPASGSVLTAQSLEPVSDSVSLSLWPSLTHEDPHGLLSPRVNCTFFLNFFFNVYLFLRERDRV